MDSRSLCFLDFDGVLNSDAYFAKNPRVNGNNNLDRKLILRLCDFLESAKCNVVVSSTWRIGTAVKELQDILGGRGFRDPVGRIVGKTGKLGGQPRGKEIQQYMRKHKGTPFVIFDDDDDMHPVDAQFVQTDPRVGLSAANVRRAVKLLKEQGARL